MLPEKQSKCAQKSTPPRKEKNKFPKKLKPPRSGRNINICEVKKNVITIIGVPANKNQVWADQKYLPQHTEKMASTWREKTAHIEKYPHRGTPTHMELFHLFSHAPPPPPPRASAYSSPLACADHDRHSFYFVCLKELEKKNLQKLNKNKIFVALT